MHEWSASWPIVDLPKPPFNTLLEMLMTLGSSSLYFRMNFQYSIRDAAGAAPGDDGQATNSFQYSIRDAYSLEIETAASANMPSFNTLLEMQEAAA